MTITLYQPPGRPWNTPNASPFCAKLETYLRITEIPYDVKPMARGQAPKGKVPYVDLGDGKPLLGDSQLIIAELEQRQIAAGKPALDAGLGASDAAIAHTVRRTLEEGTYFVMMHQRWTPEDHYEVMKGEFKRFVPGFVVPLVRRDIKKKVHGQGTARHELAESNAIGKADFAAIAELLGDRDYFFGDRPRVVDCVVFAFVGAFAGFPLDSPLKQAVQGHANLIAHHDRIRARWWKDLAAAG